MSGNISLGPEWLQNSSNTSKVTTPTLTTPTLKLPLAAHRYGREEMLLFYNKNIPFPNDMSHVPTLTRKSVIPPLAITPVSPLEQQVLSGRINSDSMRGRGRGRGGRGGRGGRQDYYREERSYYRSNSESDKTDDRVNDKSSRATQDTNWRSSTSSSTTTSTSASTSGSTTGSKEVAWVGKSWSTSSPVKGTNPGGGWSNNDDKGGTKKHWQPLPDWATTDKSDVKTDVKTTSDEQPKDDDLDIIEDVFETVAIGNETTATQPVKTGSTASTDSVEEMERRFEKAAEAILSTEDEETPHQSPVPPTHTTTDQWLYLDPQGDTQGPFSNEEMNSWFSAGYFTMSLQVKRKCDDRMLPLGQVIRIWGRTPFINGPKVPPLQPSEPFWQQIFQNQHALFPELSKPHPQLPTQQPAPIWMGINKNNTNEDQWPDLGEEQKEEERRQKMREEQEIAARHRSEEIKRQLEEEEEERRKRYEAEQKRLFEERQKEEMRRRQEEEERLLAMKREEERKRKEQEEEERKRIEEEKRIENERIQHELYQKLQLEEQQRMKDAKPHPPQGPSLIDIQKEEALEMARQQELLYQQQLIEMQTAAAAAQTAKGVPWSHNNNNMIKTSGPVKTKTSSFLEIQLEQEQQVTSTDVGGVSQSVHSRNNTAISGTSWSKVTAGSKPPPWGHTHQPSRPIVQTTPLSKEPAQPISFWEECAQDTIKTGRGRGRVNSSTNNSSKPVGASSKAAKEEEKVRQLFASTSLDDEFIAWCKKELIKYNSDVDAVTFVNLLLEVESTYEVHDYIKSFLGESDEIHSFAKQFLERRQKIRNYNTSSNSKKDSSSSSRSSKKKKKGSGAGSGKMTKVSPSSLLGFTVNAGERPNAGEIQSAKDAL